MKAFEHQGSAKEELGSSILTSATSHTVNEALLLAHPLKPAALVFVPYGIVLVRVREILDKRKSARRLTE